MKLKTPRILDLVRAHPHAVVAIIPGDLTDNGVGPADNPLIRYLCMCVCFRKERVPHEDQLAICCIDHIEPLLKHCLSVLMCEGNHDSLTQWWWGYQPVRAFLRHLYGSSDFYVKEIDGVLVFMLSVYPCERALKWLAPRLESSMQNFVISFHFNLIGPFSIFWSAEEKQAFYETIKPHKHRLLFIAVGHWHTSYVGKWQGITGVSGSGDSAVMADVQDSRVQRFYML
jgi:DNA repair exonuclease SbcCD nuclease subunit